MMSIRDAYRILVRAKARMRKARKEYMSRTGHWSSYADRYDLADAFNRADARYRAIAYRVRP